jgi:Cys-rich four helix bundle protein (predicted Tat secretion target)
MVTAFPYPSEVHMNRRDMLMTAAGSMAALSLSALADEPKAAAAPPPPATKEEGFNAALFDATLGCLRSGEVCLNHCVRLLSTGDKSMAECAGTVRAMLPMCEAMSKLTLLKSSHMKELAAVCAKTCRDCEAACKKHAKHHDECKACMESCQKCATECEKVAAA